MEQNDSFWNGLSANAPVEKTGGSFTDLPAKVWALVENASGEAAGALPNVSLQEGIIKKGDKVGQPYSFLKFKTGLIVKGGDAQVPADTFKDAYGPFFEAFVKPGEKEDQTKPLGGRLTGFLNAMFAPGVAADEKDPAKRAMVRWGATINALRKAAAESGRTLEQYNGDMGMYLAALAAFELAARPRRLLIKTNERKYTDKNGNDKAGIEVGSFEDAVPANMDNRKVKAFTSATF